MIVRFLRATRTSPRPSFASRWAAYPLAAVLSMLAAPSADAAIVTIDLSSAGSGTPQDITGVNAGMTYNQAKRTVLSFVPNGDLDIFYQSTSPSDGIGLDGDTLLTFAIISSTARANPRNYQPGEVIDGTATYSGTDTRTWFYNNSQTPSTASPNFGPNSFMGFRFGTTGIYNYGYIEVLWNWTGTPSTSTFQLLSAAYESTLNTGIAATGSTTASVPEPSTGVMGLAGLVWAGLAGFQRRRAR
jgi:hypothetical protein